MKQSEAVIAASVESGKAIKWMIRSGGLLTLLTGLLGLAQSLESGELDFKGFLVGAAFSVVYAVINTAIYFVHEYQEARK